MQPVADNPGTVIGKSQEDAEMVVAVDVAIRYREAGAAGLVRGEYSVFTPGQAHVIQGNVRGPGQLEDIVAIGQVAPIEDHAAPRKAVVEIALDGDPGSSRRQDNVLARIISTGIDHDGVAATD